MERRSHDLSIARSVFLTLGDTVVKELEIKMVKTSELIPYLGNPRTHSKKQIEQIANSIRTFGFKKRCVSSSLINRARQNVLSCFYQ